MLIENLTEGIVGQPEFKRFRRPDGRWIDDPNEAMRDIHERIRQILRQDPVPMFCATAVKGSSVVAHLQRHDGNRFLVHYDLRKAYQNVDGSALAETLWPTQGQMSLDGSPAATALERFCLLPGGRGLRTGGPASQDLFNQYCAVVLDFPMAMACARRGLTYTRYMDDILISSKNPIGKKQRQTIRQVIHNAGFSVGRTKAGVFDLAKGPVEINGLGLKRTPWGTAIFVPRRYHRRIKGLMHQAMAGNDVGHDVISGYMGFVRDIQKKSGWPLTSTDRALERAYRAYVEWYQSQKTKSTEPKLAFRTQPRPDFC